MRIVRLVPLLLFAIALGCSQEETQPAPAATPEPEPAASAPVAEKAPAPPATEEATDAALAKRGRGIYMSTCIACHNIDPTAPGAIGPAIAGASLELLTSKVLYNEYPDGYEPQRDTLLMVPLVHLEKDLPALAAYLASR